MTTLSYTRVKPSVGRIAVELVKSEEIMSGGIILLSGGTITTCGKVIELCDEYDGPDGAGPMFTLGDMVVFGKYSGSEITVGRTKVVVMNERDILGTLHEGA
jgi:chaperonin GroES